MKNLLIVLVFTSALAITLQIAAPAAVPTSTPIPAPTTMTPTTNRTKQVDPCVFASPIVLKAVLKIGLTAKIPGYFPYGPVENGGSQFTISNPHVEEVTCPHMTVTVTADVKYRKTRGFPPFQTSGKVELRSPLVAQVVYQSTESAAGAPTPSVTSSNLVSAALVLTDIDIISLKLDKSPGWLNPRWIRSCLIGKFFFCPDLIHEVSFDVTPLVKFVLNFTTL